MDYFTDLWKKAQKLGISRFQVGMAIFGKEKYRQIYKQGKATQREIDMYNLIDKTIKELAKRK